VGNNILIDDGEVKVLPMCKLLAMDMSRNVVYALIKDLEINLLIIIP